MISRIAMLGSLFGLLGAPVAAWLTTEPTLAMLQHVPEDTLRVVARGVEWPA